MGFWLRNSPATLVLICSFCAPGFGSQSQIPVECHPWGRFEPGAWKLVRVVTETFDEQGNTTGTSITETRTTLKEVGDKGVVLQVDVAVEIAGKRICAQPQTVRQAYHGEADESSVQITDLGMGKLAIEGREISCQIEQVESVGTHAKTLTRMHWNACAVPCTLKRESTMTDLKSGEVLSQSTVEVVALDMPCRVVDEIKSTAHLKTVVRHSQGTTTTLSVTSTDIPGGVIRHTAKEVDENGRLLRRSELELIDYDLQLRDEHLGLLRRWRNRLQSYRLLQH